MVEALKKELEEMQIEEPNEAPEAEEQTKGVAPEEEPKEEVQEEPKDDELEQKRQEYRKRLEERKQSEQKQREKQQSLNEQVNTTFDEKKVQEDRLKYLENVAAKMEYDNRFNAAKRELSVYEKEFKEAYPDYTDKVDDAVDFLKMNLMNQGMTEGDALAEIERQKVMTANQAVVEGRDPVEAIYKEAQNINTVIDQIAEKRGYVKQGKAADLKSARKINKPNAISSGKGASAVKTELKDDDNFDINDMTMEQMLAAKKKGEI